jgi:hypothetical protein
MKIQALPSTSATKVATYIPTWDVGRRIVQNTHRSALQCLPVCAGAFCGGRVVGWRDGTEAQIESLADGRWTGGWLALVISLRNHQPST